MNYMSTYKDLSDPELAETLSNWMGDALNSWNHFSAEEKSFFRKLQDEACKRFIEQNTKDADIEPTPKNDLGVDCISRAQVQTEIEMNASRYTIAKERGGMGQVEWSDQLIKVSDAVGIIRNLPSVTPQLSSELDKNSKKLEKNFGELDCISREQAFVAIRNLYPSMPRVDFNGSLRKWVDKYKPYIECDDAIKQLPSVTPQPKMGQWIDCDNSDDYSADGYDCSVCGVNAEYATSYCPNCGAKMVESQESEAADD